MRAARPNDPFLRGKHDAHGTRGNVVNEFVDRKLKDGRKVLAHCYAGRGRTGTFLASRLIWRGASVEEAVREVRAKIMDSQGTLAGAIEPVQTAALHRFARTLREPTSGVADSARHDNR